MVIIKRRFLRVFMVDVKLVCFLSESGFLGFQDLLRSVFIYPANPKILIQTFLNNPVNPKIL